MPIPLNDDNDHDDREVYFEAGVTFLFSDMGIPDELLTTPLFWLAE